MSNTNTQHQPSRAKRHGTEGSYASKETSKSITPPTTSAATGDRKAIKTMSDPRPAPSLPSYTQPCALLYAADKMTEDSASKLLLRELRCHGLTDASLSMILPNSRFYISCLEPEVIFWIERFSCIESYLPTFSFQDWEHLASIWCWAIDATNEHDDVKALKLVLEGANAWESPSEALRVRFWLLGNIWPCIVLEPPISETLALWFKEFQAQTAAEQYNLRRLFQDNYEQRAFDALPEEVLLSDSSGSFESQPVHKNSILGVKKVFAPRDEDLTLCVVSPPSTYANDTGSRPSESSEPSSDRPTTSVGMPGSTPSVLVARHDTNGHETGSCAKFPANYASKCREWVAYAEANPDLPLDSRPEISDRKCFIDTLSKLADAVDQLHENQEQEQQWRAMREETAHKLAQLAKRVNEPLTEAGRHRVREELYQKDLVVGAQRTLEILAEHGYAHEVAGNWYPALQFVNAEDCRPAPADPDGTSKDMAS